MLVALTIILLVAAVVAVIYWFHTRTSKRLDSIIEDAIGTTSIPPRNPTPSVPVRTTPRKAGRKATAKDVAVNYHPGGYVAVSPDSDLDGLPDYVDPTPFSNVPETRVEVVEEAPERLSEPVSEPTPTPEPTPSYEPTVTYDSVPYTTTYDSPSYDSGSSSSYDSGGSYDSGSY